MKSILFLFGIILPICLSLLSEERRELLRASLNLVPNDNRPYHQRNYTFHIPDLDTDEYHYQEFGFEDRPGSLRRAFYMRRLTFPSVNWIFVLSQKDAMFLFKARRSPICYEGVRMGDFCLVKEPSCHQSRQKRDWSNMMLYSNMYFNKKRGFAKCGIELLPQVFEISETTGVKTMAKWIQLDQDLEPITMEEILEKLPRIGKKKRISNTPTPAFLWSELTNQMTPDCHEYKTTGVITISADWSLANRPLDRIRESLDDLRTFRSKQSQQTQIGDFTSRLSQDQATLTTKYGNRVRSKILATISDSCNNLCYDSLIIYLNGILLDGGQLLLWDLDNNGMAGQEEWIDLSEIIQIIETCQVTNIKVTTSNEIQSRWLKLRPRPSYQVDTLNERPKDGPQPTAGISERKISVWPSVDRPPFLIESNVQRNYRRFQRSLNLSRVSRARQKSLC